MHATGDLEIYLKWNWKIQEYLKLESDMTCSASLKGRFGGSVDNRFQNKKKSVWRLFQKSR